ncbi:MAG: glycosyltransferase [Rhizomicrobium sp.]
MLKDLGLERGRFVLFVSTIEPRKNHAFVFTAWLKLLRRHGAKNCPKLVCVGQQGWLNSEAYARLDASEDLKRQVVILSNVSDVMLSKLYEACICTLYPSLYEGWGLPVTESLCFGKVPIVSHVASLPEAGGLFAEYFEMHSERSFWSRLSVLSSITKIGSPVSARSRMGFVRAAGSRLAPKSWAICEPGVIKHP